MMIRKRDGRVVEFDETKITDAIFEAAKSVGGADRQLAMELTLNVLKALKNENKQTEYIKSADRQLASQLAQKEYAKKVLKVAKHDKICIQRMSELKNREYYREMFCDMHAGKQILINSYDMSDEEYAGMWLAEKKKFKEEYESLAEKIIDYMLLVREFDSEKCFILLNLARQN